MTGIPDAVQELLVGFSEECMPSVWQRFARLLTAAVMVRGRRTIWRLIRWSVGRSTGHFSSYHRVLRHRRGRACCWRSGWLSPWWIALYRTPDESRKAGVVHKTPPELMRRLLAVWRRWFPQRKTVFAGDGGFAPRPQQRKKDLRQIDVSPFTAKYRRWDLNPHAHYRHRILNPACLPIPPLRRGITRNDFDPSKWEF